MPWYVGGEHLPELKLETRGTSDQIISLFQVQFSSPEGFAFYYLEFFNGFLDVDWGIEETKPIAARTWLLLHPDPLQCQSRAYRNRYSFSATEDGSGIEVYYELRDNYFSGLLTFMTGDFVSYHYAV